jgi:hypothetical protein
MVSILVGYEFLGISKEFVGFSVFCGVLDYVELTK